MPTPQELLPDPNKPFEDHSELQLLAMALFGEARGVPPETRQGIGNVIVNRALHPGWWGKTLAQVILHPGQFSCFNSGDPNCRKLREPLKYEAPIVWDRCCEDAIEVYQRLTQTNLPDPVMGANHYYDTSITAPDWADDDKFVLALPGDESGNEIRFYKL